MQLDFALTLASLTVFYGLLFVLFGSGVLNEGRQRQLSYGTLGLGLLLVYPLVTVLVVWLAPSWVFAIVCAITLALWVRLSLRYRGGVVPLLALSVRHAFTVAAVAFLFWVPGLVGPTSGLFTESGGDFTIYAGLPDKLGDEALWEVSSKKIGPFEVSPNGSSRPILSAGAEPPSAGWSVQRLIDLDWGGLNPGWYSLQYVLFQGSWGAVELQYLALLAVLWAVMVLSLQRLVRLRYGRRAGVVALLVLVSSHGLAAVGYNHSVPQLLATSLAASAAFLLALPGITALPQASRVLLAALCIAFIGIAYYPMFPAAIVPFILLVGLSNSAPFKRALRVAPLADRGLRRAVVFLAATFLIANTAALYVAQDDQISLMLSRFLGSDEQVITRDIAVLGEPRPYNLAWISALLGAISVQMLPPYATTDPSGRLAVWGLATAAIMLLSGLVWVFLRGYRRGRRVSRGGFATQWRSMSEEGRFRVSVLVALGIFLSLMVVLGRKYEYTQFKALAYVLPFTLLGCVLVACWMRRESSRPLRMLAAVAVVLLIGSLASFRLDGLRRFADAHERPAVLDPNVAALARSVREDHPQAFFVAFPADPFEYSLWEFGLRDERGLILRFFNYPAASETYIRPADVPNLWVLQDAPDLEEHSGGRKRGAVSTYPAGAATCSVRAGVLRSAGEVSVPFAPLDTATPMWLDTDVDYWIFGVQHASTLDVLVKEHQALDGRSIAVELLYPVRRKLPVPVASVKESDALGRIATAELPDSDLVVLRVTGYGYSNIRCS